MFKSIFALIAFSLFTVSVPSHATINESRIKDVYFEQTDAGDALHCKNCFSDFKHPNDIRFSVDYTGEFFGMPLEIVESKNYAIIMDHGGTGCPAGYWYLLDKRGPSSKAISAIDTDFCSETTKVTLTEDANGLKAKFRFYDSSIKPVTIKLK